jgi:SAM-dependent methyltransferase
MEGVYDEYLQRSLWAPSEPLHNWLTKRILSNFIRQTNLNPKSTNLLEIGAGTGRGALASSILNFRSYTGVEPTKKLANFLRTKRNLRIIEEYLPSLTSIKDSEFDAVFSIHVLEHASSHKEAYAYIEEMKRITRKDGLILIVSPDIRDYGSFFWDSDWSHGFPTTPNRIAQIMRDQQIKVVCEKTMHIGSLNLFSYLIGKFFNLILPTSIGDRITKKIFVRPLVSGAKIALFWGLTFVIGQK